jgi:hypothetical protein
MEKTIKIREGQEARVIDNLRNTRTRACKPKRTWNCIRADIVHQLEIFPGSTYSVAKRTQMDWRVCQRHMRYLEAVGRVERLVSTDGRGREINHWRLV